jgi:hypothetical protein
MPLSQTDAVELDRRGWQRIDDRLLLEYRLIGQLSPCTVSGTDPQSVTAIHDFVSAPTDRLLNHIGPDDPQAVLVPWLMKIDWAVALLIGALAQTVPGGLPLPKMTPVNISATGISFPTGQRFHEGDHIEVKLILPPFFPIAAVAEVSRVTQAGVSEGKECLIGARFIDISVDHQEHLIRHILHVQAEQQRGRRRPAGRSHV